MEEQTEWQRHFLSCSAQLKRYPWACCRQTYYMVGLDVVWITPTATTTVLYFLFHWPGIPGFCFGTVITTGFAVVLLLNLVLWLNLNYLLFKRQKSLGTHPTRKKRFLEEILEEITDPLWIIIVSCFSWIVDIIRCVIEQFAIKIISLS